MRCKSIAENGIVGRLGFIEANARLHFFQISGPQIR